VRGLRAKLLLAAALLMLVLVGLVAGVTLPLVRRSAEQQAVAETARVAATMARLVADRLDLRLDLRHPQNRAAATAVMEVASLEWRATAVVFASVDGLAELTLPGATLSDGDRLRLLRIRQTGARVAEPDEATGGHEVVACVPVLADDRTLLGALLVRRPADESGAADVTAAVALLYIVLETLLVGLVGYLLLTRSVLRPISALSEAAGRVTAGDLTVQVDGSQQDEVGALGRDFNLMVARIRSDQRALDERLQQLQLASDELVRRERLSTLGQLSAGVAHEIGNPLAAVMGLVELLRDSEGLSAVERADVGQRVERELDRIHAIIQTLLDYARGGEVRRVEQDVAVPVAAAVSLLTHHPRVRQIRLRLMPPAEPVSFALDESRLVQVLLNLVLNASDAMKGEGEVEVAWQESRSATGERWCSIAVSDRGPGWAEEVRGRATHPFVTTKAAGAGTGLGLSICERIAAELGGRLTLGDRAGGGAEAAIWLPMEGQPSPVSGSSPASGK
jgi:signal transduction histidine kinase